MSRDDYEYRPAKVSTDVYEALLDEYFQTEERRKECYELNERLAIAISECLDILTPIADESAALNIDDIRDAVLVLRGAIKE